MHPLTWTSWRHSDESVRHALHSWQMAVERDGEVSPVLHTSDLDLARRARAGDALAIELLCRRLACVPAILRDRHARYGSPLKAEDLEEVQQATLVALWSKLGSFEGRASLETWAFRFTVLELLKCLARYDRGRRLIADADAELARTPDREAPEPPMEPERIHASLDAIGPPANDIIRMRHFEERSFDDIAQAYAEPVNTIKARYYRGLQRLREILQRSRGG
jgi:RNA polymerase sigma-70 factor, ECF subfamily